LAEGRHASTSPRTRVKPVVWIVPIALVVIGGLGFLLFGRGDGAHPFGIGEDNHIPTFAFKEGRTSAVAVKAGNKDTGVPQSAKAAAGDVTTTMTELYKEAFLDPANWRDGSYDEVWPLFVDAAAQPAQQHLSALTVGTDGGDAYTTIDQPNGHLTVRVLLDDKNQPTTAVAIVDFTAVGTQKAGKLTMFHSVGQYFLRPEGDGWRVYSFDVRRNDQVEAPSPSASASGSTS
jgi:hypothetical protein